MESNNYKEYIKVVRSMELCLNYDVKLQVNPIVNNSSSFQPDFSAYNKAIEELLKARKEVAKRYFEDKISPEAKYESIQIFLKYNEEIRRIVGL
jgi:hypothetical protein